MIRHCIGLAAAASLAACATSPPEPIVKTVEVRTPVAVSCVPKDTPPRLTYSDTDAALKAAPDLAGRYQLLASEHSRRVSRAEILEAVVDACRKAGP
jgi:hypothetical protein